MTWFLLAILAPLLFAIINVIDDNLMDKVFDNAHFAVIISGLFTAFPLLAIIALTPFSLPSTSTTLLAISSGFIMTCSWYFYFDALRTEPPSIVVTVYNLQAGFTALIAYLLLNEILTINQYLGFLILFIASLGITAIDIKKFKFSKIILTVSFAALLVAISNIINDHIFTQTKFLNAFTLILFGNTLAGLAFLIATPSGRQFTKKWKILKSKSHIFFIAEGLSVIAFLAFDRALSLGPASLVSVLGGLQPVYILLLSIALYPLFPKFFREATHGRLPQKSLFILLMLTGLIFLNLP